MDILEFQKAVEEELLAVGLIPERYTGLVSRISHHAVTYAAGFARGVIDMTRETVSR